MSPLLAILSIALTIYVSLKALADLVSKCCYGEPDRKACVASVKLWGDDLAATVSNPELLKKAAIVKYVRSLEKVSNIKLLARGDALYSLSRLHRLRLLVRLISRCGFRVGVNAYRLFNLCVNPPERLEDSSLYKFCVRLLKWSEVLEGGCGG